MNDQHDGSEDSRPLPSIRNLPCAFANKYDDHCTISPCPAQPPRDASIEPRWQHLLAADLLARSFEE